ncbi:MAG: DNA/RNA nuclease SfsA [Dehalobacterium sp.]
MRYQKIKTALFLKRPNRFVAHVILDGKEEIVHVKNTGRCRELLQPNARVILEESQNPNRKTKYSLIAVYKDELLINMDSQAPNTVVWEGIKANKIDEIKHITVLKKEVTYGQSRFDLYFEDQKNNKGFVEVKGVTLENHGVAMFPDAPTLRGTKHVQEMMRAVKEGYQGFIIFLVQMQGIKYFTPHRIMDQNFSAALKEAKESGVNILVFDAQVTENSISFGKRIDYCLI